MPTITLDVRAVTNQNDDIVALELVRGDQSVALTARRDWTLDRLAQEILAQNFPGAVDTTHQGRLTITFHTEQDPETGANVRVLDDAAVDPLPAWSDWTEDEAAAWIDANVTDLASVKAALREMARALVFLRTWATR